MRAPSLMLALHRPMLYARDCGNCEFGFDASMDPMKTMP